MKPHLFKELKENQRGLFLSPNITWKKTKARSKEGPPCCACGVQIWVDEEGAKRLNSERDVYLCAQCFGRNASAVLFSYIDALGLDRKDFLIDA